MTAIGSNKIGKAYLGANEVSKMYLGSDLVYQNVVTSPNYLCFTALEDGVFTLTIPSSITSNYLNYIEYSTDGTIWTKINNVDSQEIVITTPTITSGNSVYWRGKGSRMCLYNATSLFSSTCLFKASGNLSSLLFLNDFESKTATTSYCYTKLFYNNKKIVSAINMELGKYTAVHTFNNTFHGCTSLTDAPIMQNVTIAARGYQDFFSGCTSLNYIKMLSITASSDSLYNWLNNTTNVSTNIFVKNINATWTQTEASGVPTNWTIIYYDPSEDRYYTSQDKSQECDDHGNPIS